MPSKESYQHIPPHMYDDVRTYIQEMLDIGAIQKSHSPWASAVVLVWRKDCSLRFCINLKKLNNQTIKDAYLLHHRGETLNSLQGSKWFSSLNLKLGYWQVEMDEESKPLTLHSSWGCWASMSAKGCLLDSPMAHHFPEANGDLSWNLNLHWCIIYLDDILIFSKDLTSHHKRLGAVFGELEEAGLKLKPSKCKLFQWQIGYLGHVISAKEIATDEGKIEAIKKWPIPKKHHRGLKFPGIHGISQAVYPKIHTGSPTPA